MKTSHINTLYNKIESLSGTESEVSHLLKRQAELELQNVQQQTQIEVAMRDKRLVESELGQSQDKIK